MDADRRDRTHEKPNLRIALMWLVLSLIFLAVGLQRILQGQFPDPDDALRLVQVRDLIGGQPWFDLHQYRIDPPAGTLMHWSRLVDIPLLIVIGLLTPLIGAGAAETIALIVVPLLTLGGVLFFIGRLAWRLFDTDVAAFTCLCVGLFAPLVFQLQPMRIDHHGWQIFTVAMALWACAHRSPLMGGAIAGVAMALGITISLEILPMVAAFGGILALRWFRDRDDRWWLVGYMQSLALTMVVAFFATRGIADLAQHCDVVSPAHLGFFVITAVGTGAIAVAPKMPRFALAGTFALAGAAGLMFFALSSPGCVMTPFAALDPLVRDYWYINVSEGRPLWEQRLDLAIPSFVQLLVALAASVALALRSRDWLRAWWTDYTLLLVASIILSLLVWRSAAFAAIIGAVPLGWLTVRLLRRFRLADGFGTKVAMLLAIMLVLLPAIPVRLWELVAPADETAIAIRVEESKCAIRDQAEQLDALPQGIVFAPLDIGPSILLKSHHGVIGTGHHRAEAAMSDVIAAFIGKPEDARQIIVQHRANYVVMCTDLAEAGLYAASAPDGLAAQLVSGNVPAWLEPLPTEGPEEFRVWRVR